MCPTGMELHQQYEVAERQKVAATSRNIPEDGILSPNDKHIAAAKQRYVETFANWLSHRAFCHDCKPGAPAPNTTAARRAAFIARA